MARALPAGKIVAIAVTVLAPLAIHAVIATDAWPPLVVAIPVVQLVALAAITAIRVPRLAHWLLPFAAIVAAGGTWAIHSGFNLSALVGLPHAIAYSVLLFGFGQSLRPGHEAFLTRIVQAVRGPLPPELVRHTRRVTFTWCCFFAGQLLASVLLYLFAPLEVWSFFINVLNLPLILLMLAAEGIYRFIQFRNFPMDSLSDIVQLAAKTAETWRRQVDRA